MSKKIPAIAAFCIIFIHFCCPNPVSKPKKADWLASLLGSVSTSSNIQCKNKGVWDSSSGSCDCSQATPCYWGTDRQADCGCECDRVDCHEPFLGTINWDNCYCTCHGGCPKGATQQDDCSCQCGPNVLNCGQGKTASDCTCDCSDVICPTGKVLTTSCECICPSYLCQNNAQMIPDTCDCDCSTAAFPCRGTVNSDCSCDCGTTSCGQGYINADCSCDCTTVQCGKGQYRGDCSCDCTGITCSGNGTLYSNCLCSNNDHYTDQYSSLPATQALLANQATGLNFLASLMQYVYTWLLGMLFG